MAEVPREQPGHEELRQRDRRRGPERQGVERRIEVVMDQGEEQELQRARDDEDREDHRRGRRPEPAEDADRLVDPMKANEVADESGAIKREISPPGTDRVHQQERGNSAEPGAQSGLRHEPGHGQDGASQDCGDIGRECPGLAFAPWSRLDRELRSNRWPMARPGRGSRPHGRDEGRLARHKLHGRPPSMGRKEELGETRRLGTAQSIRRAVVHPGRAAEIIGRSLSEVNLGSEMIRWTSVLKALPPTHRSAMLLPLRLGEQCPFFRKHR